MPSFDWVGSSMFVEPRGRPAITLIRATELGFTVNSFDNLTIRVGGAFLI